MFPLQFRGEVNGEETIESWCYSVVKVGDPNFNRFWLIRPCDGQTDGQYVCCCLHVCICAEPEEGPPYPPVGGGPHVAYEKKFF